jgi:hypothetical protein
MDFDKMPLEELLRLRSQVTPQAAPSNPAPQALDFDAMPLEQLMAMREQIRAAQAPQQQAPADERPWYQKLGSAADDIVRIGANAVTLGGADRIAGYMGGRGAQAERADTAAASGRAGLAGTVAEIGGMMVPGIGAAKLGAAAAGAIAPRMAAATGAAGLAGRTLGMGAVGAGLGATESALKDEDVQRGAVMGALSGAAGNVAGEALAKGIGAVGGMLRTKPNVPTREALDDAATAAYKRADDAGVIYSPKIPQQIAREAQERAANFGYHPENQPGVKVALEELNRVAGSGNVTAKGLDVARRVASGGFRPGNQSNNKLLGDILRSMDDGISKAGAGDVIAGDPRAAAEALAEARSSYARASKSARVDDLLERAAIRTESTGSGGNINNVSKQEIGKILNEAKTGRGFTQDERDLVRDIIRGTPTQNVLRQLGKLSPQGNGLMLALQTGAAAGTGGASLPLAGLGAASKFAADKMTQNRIADLDKLIRAGGSKEAAFGVPHALERLSQEKRRALAAALMSSGLAVSN